MLLTTSIVLYNNDRDILKQAIDSVLDSRTDFDFRLYLIDNSPTDALKDLVVHEKLEYIHNPSNPGFGAAHNISIKKALEAGVKYHLVLNPDAYFDADVLQKLITYMDQNEDIGNLMPKVLYPDNSLQYLCKLLPRPYDWIGRRFNPFKGMVEKNNNRFELRFTNYDKIMEVPYLSGCFMLLRTDALKKTGLFDDNIFMYGEETDICRRLISAGYKTVFYPLVHIYHHFAKGSHNNRRLTIIGIQSAIYYFNKWGWFFDKERKAINKRTLEKLNYHD